MTLSTAFAAFRDQLKALCLDEFPCGTGSWNKSRFEWRKGHLHSIKGSMGKDRNAGEESAETLTEFLRYSSSPWVLEDNWSAEAQQLRELAVTSPQLMRNSFIFQYFRSLRLVDKGVNEVDENILWFKNLEKLILSANKISRVNSTNLPRTLKVLELCGNEITSLKELCADPLPNLQHLGLACNRLSYSSDSQYLTPRFWPSLISLDLSFNNFTDLVGIVSKLAGLPQLRSLLLQGNPLAFFAGYRGFIIDALPQLCALDDIMISPDEKYQYKGMAQLKDILMNKSRVMVNIKRICGLPNPNESLETENVLDFPIISRKYYLTYDFISDEPSEETDVVQAKEFLQVLSDESPVQYSSRPSECSSEQRMYFIPLDPLLQETQFNTALYKTPSKQWEEVTEINYHKEHELRDVLALKSFFFRGTTVTFIEENTLSWPVQPSEELESKTQLSKKEKAKKSKSDTKAAKKQKKRKATIELRHDPPTLRSLGSVHVSLETLLLESHLEIVCNFGVLFIPPPPPPPPSKKPSSPKSKESKLKGKKSKLDRGSAKSIRSVSSTKGKKKSKEIFDADENPSVNSVPLTAAFKVQLLQWMTATDALY